MTARRGEVWRYDPVVARRGISTLRLIVSADPINNDRTVPVVLAVNIVETDPGSLLAVPVDDFGWANAVTVQPIMRSRLLERMAIATPDTMDQVSAALRAAQDL